MMLSKRIAVLLSFCAVIVGCVNRLPVPEQLPATWVWPMPAQVLIQVTTEAQQKDFIVLLQHEPKGLRVSLFDPLGVPQARKLLKADQWRNEGLLPPNPQADAWIAALIFALVPEDKLHTSYPQAVQSGQERHLPAMGWRVEYLAEHILIADGQQQTQLRLQPMEW